MHVATRGSKLAKLASRSQQQDVACRALQTLPCPCEQLEFSHRSTSPACLGLTVPGIYITQQT